MSNRVLRWSELPGHTMSRVYQVEDYPALHIGFENGDYVEFCVETPIGFKVWICNESDDEFAWDYADIDLLIGKTIATVIVNFSYPLRIDAFTVRFRFTDGQVVLLKADDHTSEFGPVEIVDGHWEVRM